MLYDYATITTTTTIINDPDPTEFGAESGLMRIVRSLF